MRLISMFPYVKIVFRSMTLTVLVWLGSCMADRSLSANFVFGDSLVEVGNNNYIASLSRANYMPNGIDFGMPTGRFTNGRIIIDIIGEELGLKNYTPPYLAPTTAGPLVLSGVNYASGAGGIVNETGKMFIGRINMDAQLDNFENTRKDIISRIGVTAAQELFNGALFSVTMGSNDFINNYLVPIFSTVERKLVSPEAFVATLTLRFRLQLTRLYNLGARKILIPNVGPIGCIPFQRDVNHSEGNDCVAFPNYLAQLYNGQLKSLLEELNNELKGSTFLFADVYNIVTDIIQNHKSYGFENGDSACCYVTGRHGGLIPCGPTSKVCTDRSKYVFWDPYHPSDAANIIIAKRVMDGGREDISPINIRALFQT